MIEAPVAAPMRVEAGRSEPGGEREPPRVLAEELWNRSEAALS